MRHFLHGAHRMVLIEDPTHHTEQAAESGRSSAGCITRHRRRDKKKGALAPVFDSAANPLVARIEQGPITDRYDLRGEEASEVLHQHRVALFGAIRGQVAHGDVLTE